MVCDRAQATAAAANTRVSPPDAGSATPSAPNDSVTAYSPPVAAPNPPPSNVRVPQSAIVRSAVASETETSRASTSCDHGSNQM